MGLLDLPGELLDEIIALTLPNGFVAFALSCKTIYERATAQIDRYDALRQRWTYAARPSNDRGKAFHMLYELSRDELLSQCVHVLNLRSPLGDDSESDTSQLTDEFRMEEDAMDGIKRLVLQSEWLEQAGIDTERWWHLMMREDEAVDDQDRDPGLPYAVVSLLSRLPRLQTLQLPETWKNVNPGDSLDDEQKEFVYVLDSLVRYANRSTQDTALKSLETLLPFMPAGYEARAGLQCIEPLLSLPGLRELYAISMVAVDDSYTGIPLTWRSRLNSQLRRIELAYCCIDGDGISVLLQHAPLVEVFRYSHETKWHGCQHDWNPGAFVNQIARHCGATITDMSITIDDLHGEIVNGASSFLSFVKLQRLEVDVHIFCGPPVESGQRHGMSAYVPDGEQPWTQHDIPCIGSMVPASIQNLTVNTDYPGAEAQALRSLLKNVRQQRDERLPELQSVIVRQQNTNAADEVFGIPNLVICVDGNEGEGMHGWPRAMLPMWKRGFAERVGGIAYV